ncbi:flagellar filament capping protein FliD [Dyella koreensis]|uniref:Flagellar hook-associated protein 2 n=1 Tax=Dyella koreensis TaxID=311235 RepID=A0ABW8K5J3_9GAMM
MIIDPTKPGENALYFSELYMHNAFERLDAQLASATRTSEAVSKLRSALSAFQSALGGLSSSGGIIKYQGILSNPALGSVSIGDSAQAGSYAFFVEQLATAHQLAVGNIPATDVAQAGVLMIDLGDGSSFDVDLTKAKPDANGNITTSEIARLVNEASGNKGNVSASVVTVNGSQQLVLTSGKTGTDGAITLDTSGIGDSSLAGSLGGASEMIAARNAVFYLGGQGGTRIEQSSNTFDGIQDVSITFTAAMQAGDPALVLSISRDSSATQENVQSFVDAYNALKSVLDELCYAGDGTPGSAGPMAGDAGVRALQLNLNDILRQTVGSVGLRDFGIGADRDGKLSLDTTKFNAALAADPSRLEALFGEGDKSLTGKFDKYMAAWLDTKGQISSREESVKKIQDLLSKRQSTLEDQYTRTYERYLAQFNRLYVVDQQMKYTMEMLEALTPRNGKN